MAEPDLASHLCTLHTPPGKPVGQQSQFPRQRAVRANLAMWFSRRVLGVPVDVHQSFFAVGKSRLHTEKRADPLPKGPTRSVFDNLPATPEIAAWYDRNKDGPVESW